MEPKAGDVTRKISPLYLKALFHTLVMSNICRLFIKPCFASFQGRTAVKKNSYNPVWNEQIVFTEMFPPLCQRIKIQLRESATVGDAVVGTHYLDLSSISNDGDKGKLLF